MLKFRPVTFVVLQGLKTQALSQPLSQALSNRVTGDIKNVFIIVYVQVEKHGAKGTAFF